MKKNEKMKEKEKKKKRKKKKKNAKMRKRKRRRHIMSVSQSLAGWICNWMQVVNRLKIHTIGSSVEWSSLNGRGPWWFTVRKMDLLYKDDTVSVTASRRVKIPHGFSAVLLVDWFFSQRESSMLIYRKKKKKKKKKKTCLTCTKILQINVVGLLVWC